MKRMKSASPTCDPWNLAGRTTLRMYTAAATPTSTNTTNRSTSQGSSGWLSAAAIIAKKSGGKSQRNPQKIDGGVRPGSERLKQFLLAGDDPALVLPPPRDVHRAIVRLRTPHLLCEKFCAMP